MKMIRFLLLYGMILPLLAACGVTMPEQQAEKRLALVMGNNEYPILKQHFEQGIGNITKDPTLRQPVEDARDMKQTLRELGFSVYYGENLSLKEMKAKLNDFVSHIDEDTLAFVYYSGHGASDEKQLNYLIPSDYDGHGSALAVDEIAFSMKDKKGTKNILALDMCRDSGVSLGEKGSKSLGKGDLTISSPYNPNKYRGDGLLISYATDQGSTAKESDQENSVYTHVLLKHIKDDTLSLSALFETVNKEVAAINADGQSPSMQNSIKSVDIFLAKTAINSGTASPP